LLTRESGASACHVILTVRGVSPWLEKVNARVEKSLDRTVFKAPSAMATDKGAARAGAA